MSHYFINDPNLKSEIHTVSVTIKNQNYRFYTDNGVFSKKGLDFGTRTLLEALPLSDIHGTVLDFGCGYGPIGIFLSKETDAEVHMVDINERSLSLAKKNAEQTHVNPTIFLSDKYSNITENYDFIITNPPIRVGKKVLYEILFDAKKHLKKSGELWLVIHKDQGAKSLYQDLKSEYRVEIVTKNKGFFIIRAISDWL